MPSVHLMPALCFAQTRATRPAASAPPVPAASAAASLAPRREIYELILRGCYFG